MTETTTTTTLPVSADEARAMLAAEKSGSEVVIRRRIEPQPVLTTVKRDIPQGCGGESFRKGWRWNGQWVAELGEEVLYAACPFGKPGDALAVSEDFSEPLPLDAKCQNFTGFYRASDPGRKVKWRPADTMPAWASRLTFAPTRVSVERSDAGEWQWVLTGRCEFAAAKGKGGN